MKTKQTMRLEYSKSTPFTHTRRHNKGYVMVTVLILVLVMGGLSASMYGNVGLQEKMSSSMRLKKRVFHAADSSIQSIWDIGGLLGNNTTALSSAQIVDRADDFDSGTTDLEANATICYGGEIINAPGMGRNADEGVETQTYAYHAFTVVGTARNINSNAQSVVGQGGYLERVSAGLPAVVPCP